MKRKELFSARIIKSLQRAARRIIAPALLSLTFAFTILFASAKSFAQSPGGSASFVTGEVVVKLSDSSVLPAVAAQYKLDPHPLSQFGSRPIYRLKITDGQDV